MGASGWSYRVDYDSDVGAALGRLQRQVFTAGQYEQAWNQFGPEMRADMARDLAEMAEMMGEELDPESVVRLTETGEPATIDEALMWAADSGTHSILDIAYGVADRPDFGYVTALDAASYQRFFGTTQPTVEEVEAKLLEVDSFIEERWQGVYVVAYLDREPVQLFFVGVSGD